MNFPRAAEGRGPGPDSDDSYSRWVRTAMKAAATAPDAAVLFDSTIREPTELLTGAVRRAFGGAVTDRYESVFAEGNRYVVAAVAARHGVSPDQVIGATGATSAVALVLKALVSPGDNVLIEQPCFDLLPSQARDAGANVTALPRRAPDYAVAAADIARLVKPNTRLVVLTQLHNPSGAVLNAKTMGELAAVSRQTGVPILIDEAYAEFVDGGVCAARLGPEFISVGSLTKVQGLFALKCGWAVAAPEVIARVQAATPQGDYGVSKLTHAVAALVLEDRAPFDAHWRAVLAEARPVVEAHVEAMAADGLIEGALPSAGCMFFPKICGVDDTRALAQWLWSEHGVLVAAGEYFGQGGHVRIGFGGGRPQALDAGLTRLHAALKAYPGAC
ncbi:pyridoxal phosphate-dependent aminotransferase [Phenylobacterium sp.]|uniref:pyridoxal phosphate-dependent aminotransferase n=1 Tax=Phenylobacterium sp. TaxID=1871053 RepID=UPI002E349DE8|nr:pyridoxal phosphate-dependent aminotransferase [Phenylobacterium sp.]HEX3366326.1 pyridoxal phosphate-dependent aminotransferase [Phenylobacterium sp.]